MKKNILIFIAMLLIGVNTSQAADGTGNTGWRNFALASLDGNIPGGDVEPTSNPQVYIGADGAISNASFTEALFSVKLWGNFIYKSATNPYIGFKEDNSNDYNYIKVTSLKSGYYIKKIVLYDSNMSEGGGDDNNPVITASNGTWSIGYYSGGQSTSPSTATIHNNNNATHIVATCSSATNGNSVTIKADDHTRFSYIYIEYNTKELNSIDTSTPFQYTCAFSTTAHQVNYTGSTITPVSNVKSISSYLNRNLTKDTHYTVTGTTSAMAPGKYSTTIAAKTGVGALANGSVSFNWWITKSITHSDITVEVDPVVFNGTEYDLAAVKSKVKVYDMIGGTKTLLTEGTHYTLSWISGHSQFLNAKTYVDELVITGVADNGYTGERRTSFTISQRDISEVALETAKEYASDWSVDQAGLKTWIQADAQGNIKYDTYKLIENTDYTISIKTDTYHDAKVYTGAITLTAKDNGNFTGTATWDFEISNGTNIAENYIVVYVDNIYTGQNLPPTKANTKVYKGGTLLTADTDYTWAMAGGEADYKDAKTYANAVIIKGKNQYFGTIYANYVIARRDLQDVTFTEASKMAWTGSSITPNINAASDNNITAQYAATPYNLVAADYTYTSEPTSIKDPGEYTLTFEGRGNFMGTKQMTVHVLKSFSSQGGDVTLDLTNGSIILPKDGTLTTADITVKDGTTELVEGTDYTAVIYTKSDKSASVASITDSKDGIYWIELTGNDYSWTDSKLIEFCVLNEYYVKGNTQLDDDSRVCSLHLTEANKAALGTANTDPVIATDATELTIPATATITLKDGQGTGSTSTTKVVDIVDIEDGAFNGCSTLRFIDARLIANYTPSSLNRTATNTPFTGLPKQTLVYLTGTTVEGENYIYNTGAGLNCETFKIYDDISGTQTGFTTATDAKWDMEIPVAFTANNIVNTRKLTAVANNKQQGYTVCLPYALPIPESVTAYQLSYSKTDQLGFTEVAATELTAMRPYVLIPSASGQCLSTTNATVSQTVKYESGEWKYEACTSDPASSSAVSGQSLYKLTGSMQYKEGDAAKDKYIMQGNNVWGKILAGAGYSETDRSCILPMRAYIEANGTATARLFSTFNNADGSTTVVKGLQIDADAASEIYDLQGRKVAAPQRNGLYIVNGKKTIVK